MFLTLLYSLRGHGLAVGLAEWLAFLEAVRTGLVTDLNSLYGIGRAIMCRSEADYDRFDLAFASTFENLEIPSDMREKLRQWLAEAVERPEGEFQPHEYETMRELWDAFLERLNQQEERHDRGNQWVGTGGTSPFGNSGLGENGVRVGGPGGGRSAVRVAMDRRWANYRNDRTLDIRDLQVVLRTLRSMIRDGRMELDLDATIDATAQNAGDIELIEQPERRNRLHVVLLMDAGGSMAPHAHRVERLFSAASRVKTFRSLDIWYFHNCVYGWLYKDFEQFDRTATEKVVAGLTPKHRLIFVGDASMAPYELFSAWGWYGDDSPSGMDWLRRLRAKCPASVWLNPETPRWWNHPTVSAIGRVFPMFELTEVGLRQAVRKLRVPV